MSLRSGAPAFNEFESSALAAIDAAKSAEQLEQVRIDFLGQKKGRLRNLQSLVGKASKKDKPTVGKRFNDVRTRVAERLEAQTALVASRTVRLETGLDVTLPGTVPQLGTLHPVTKTIVRFREIMGRFGFKVVDGP